MTFLITILHIFACVALIMIVLLQTGKGADIGASMGGAGGQTMFGTSTASTLLGKITTGIAILFMLTSLFLAYESGHRVNNGSVMDNLTPAPVETTVPNEVPAPADEAPVTAPSADQGGAEGAPAE